MAITYMTEEGYKKLMEEIAYLEKEISLKMPSTMPPKRRKECSK